MPVHIQQAPADSFIDCTAFEVLGLQQPFTVSVSSNVYLLMVSGPAARGWGRAAFL
jgi:hypothetical protein